MATSDDAPPISPTAHFPNFLLSPVIDLKTAFAKQIANHSMTFSGMEILHEKKTQIAFGSASPKVLALL